MNDIITRKDERLVRFNRQIEAVNRRIEKIAKSRTPLMGECYLTDRELSERLKVSRRTLQEWRTQGMIAYIMLGGKTIYRESDIQALLTNHYRKAWRD